MNTNQPFFRSEMTFNKAFRIDKLAKCIYDLDEQMKWDKNIVQADVVPVIEGKQVAHTSYTQNRKVFSIKSRDFYDKGLAFTHNEVFYRFSSAVNNSEEVRPPPKDTIRGETLINYAKMWRDPVDNKVKYISVIQCDFKLKIPPFIFSSFLPGAFKKF